MTFVNMLKHNADLSGSEVWVKFLVYPFSMPLSWFAINYTSASANVVTLTGLLVCTLGCVLSLLFGLPALILGYFLAYVLDFVDGQVACARGGSRIGVLLDLLVDRASLLMAAVSLAWYHLGRSETIAVFLILMYIAVYFFQDTWAGARDKAELAFGKPRPRGDPKPVHNTLVALFGDPLKWLPTRLVSPVFIALAWLATDDARVGYLTGIVCAVSELMRNAVTVIWRKLCKR